MVEKIENCSTTLIQMPTGINGVIIKHSDWHYVCINSKASYFNQIKSYIHELLHIKLGHLEQYDIAVRCKNEDEVNKILSIIYK